MGCCELTRRAFVGSAASCALAQAPGFRHRGYLGWITDLASEPDPHAAWPSMRIDERLLADYRESLRLMRGLGFNEISIWGLYVARAWPLDIVSAVSRERGAAVERLIEDAHREGIRVLSGLGVYSWGFDEIIRANPKLNRGNPRAMCASEPESWTWMRKVVDFVFARFPIDGVSMQSADQGRCACDRCRRYTDPEYHALLNRRVSGYIRERRPKATIGVNSWGLRFEQPDTLASLVEMSRYIDYLIDVHDTSRRRDPAYRREVIGAVKCDFGTLGGPQVEPPQHWARDRWFLPTGKREVLHLAELHRDGGRACEFFFHILRNPGGEVSLRAAAKMLERPDTSPERAVREAVAETFEARDPDGLAELVVRAEDAYCRYLPAGFCGTISMEPLVSSEPGPPVYLDKRLTVEERKAYAEELGRLAAGFSKAGVGRKDKIAMVVRAIGNARADALGRSS